MALFLNSETCDLSWVNRKVFAHIEVWTNTVVLFSDVGKKRVFILLTCHSAQKDKSQDPEDVRQYNQQVKRSTDKHSLPQLCQLRQKIKSLSTVWPTAVVCHLSFLFFLFFSFFSQWLIFFCLQLVVEHFVLLFAIINSKGNGSAARPPSH